jgi:putative endonuclease
MSGGPDARTPAERRRAVSDGAAAEERVAAHLEASGWEVLERRWRGAGGELDLVVRSGARLRFVEVKLRAADSIDGWESFTPAKMARVRRAAELWLSRWGGPVEEACLMAALVERSPEGWRVSLLDDPA